MSYLEFGNFFLIFRAFWPCRSENEEENFDREKTKSRGGF